MRSLGSVEWGHCQVCKRVVQVFIVKDILVNGAQMVYKVCFSAGKPHRLEKNGRNIAHAYLHDRGIRIEDIPVINENTFVKCEVDGCPNMATEGHHIASKEIWGAESELWPMYRLCVPHHQEWHRKIKEFYERRQPILVKRSIIG